ncbi:hypothetical protein ACWD00_40620 [Streptomyces viridiviolaceus]
MSTDDVMQLVLHERQSRHRGGCDRMADCFAEDCVVKVSWFKGSGADFMRTTSARPAAANTPCTVLGPPVVHLNGDRALTELPLINEWRVGIDGVEAEWLLRRRDHLGDDQPDAVQRPYQAEMTCLHEGCTPAPTSSNG